MRPLAIFVGSFLVLASHQGVAKSPATPGNNSLQARLVTITGVVEEVQQVPADPDETVVLVKATGKILLVDLAPTAYLAYKDFAVRKGDEVTIEGTMSQDTQIAKLDAYSIQTHSDSMVLRYGAGTPIWKEWTPPALAAKIEEQIRALPSSAVVELSLQKPQENPRANSYRQ